jgi:hypothetical protein
MTFLATVRATEETMLTKAYRASFAAEPSPLVSVLSASVIEIDSYPATAMSTRDVKSEFVSVPQLPEFSPVACRISFSDGVYDEGMVYPMQQFVANLAFVEYLSSSKKGFVRPR